MLAPGKADRFSAPGDSRHFITTETQWNLERESRPAFIIDNQNWVLRGWSLMSGAPTSRSGPRRAR